MITFKKTANHIHEIYINGHKAGLLRLLAHHPDATVSDNEPKDWRVFSLESTVIFKYQT